MNESKSDTPLTDAELFEEHCGSAHVRASFAQKLERELAAATERLRAAEASYQDATATYDRIYKAHELELKVLEADNARLAERNAELTKHDYDVSEELGNIAAMICREPEYEGHNSDTVREIMQERDALKAENARLAERVNRLAEHLAHYCPVDECCPKQPANKPLDKNVCIACEIELADKALAAGKADQRAGGEVAK